MGTPKALLDWKGVPLARWLAFVLQSGGAASVLVITAPGIVGEEVAAAIADLPFARSMVNSEPERGMLSSVQEGLSYLFGPINPFATQVDTTGFLVCPVDLPKLEPAQVGLVLNSGRCRADSIVVPVTSGKRGHPTWFGRGFVPEILGMDPRQVGLNELLRRVSEAVVEVPVPGDGICRDADTPEEWRRLMEGM